MNTKDKALLNAATKVIEGLIPVVEAFADLTRETLDDLGASPVCRAKAERAMRLYREFKESIQ